LEKIEMKKTLVAVAAMAAVTGAMAQATIYGLIDQAYQSDKTTAGTTAATKKTGISSTLNGGSQFGFKGSEDLGGGLTASFVMELGYETSDKITGGMNNRQSFVGLAGGFGSVNVGRQYSNIFLAACGNDVSSCAAMVGVNYLVAADSIDDVRRANAINYSLPSIVPGVTIQVGKSYGEATTSPTSTNAGNGSSYTLGYSAGAIAATLASESRENEGNHPAFQNAQAASLTAKRKTTVTGLSYDAGVAKLLYTNTKSTIGTGVTKFSMTGIIFPMGAASIAFQAGTGETKSIASTTTSKLKGSLVNFNYSLSKRTTAYVKVGSHSETTAAGANALKISTTAVGIAHGF
jgi:predicted porin